MEPRSDWRSNVTTTASTGPPDDRIRNCTTFGFGLVSLDITRLHADDSGIFVCKAANKLEFTACCRAKCSVRNPLKKIAFKCGTCRKKRRTTYRSSTFPILTSSNAAKTRRPTLNFASSPARIRLCRSNCSSTANCWTTARGSRWPTISLSSPWTRPTSTPDTNAAITCWASNAAGEAFTTTTVYCEGKEGLSEETQHPEGEADWNRFIEDFLLLSSGRPNADEGGNAPVFTSQFQNVTSPDLTNLLEGDIAHFEATLRSRSDHDGRIIFNGQFLKLGHRERTVHAFGMVFLEIIGTKFKDSDIYTYRYSNTFISFFKYKDRYNIFENFWRAGLATNETWLKFGIRQAGHWLRPVGSHDSGGNICKSSVPTSLASLFSSLTPPRRIQWIHNGHQFGSGPRIRMLDDFGFVVLVIDWIFPWMLEKPSAGQRTRAKVVCCLQSQARRHFGLRQIQFSARS